ncbi:hypothetical protein H6F47_03675 [Sphaerospermopsis sp. FACHB-1094]|nr:hypothetical protein [Sphaerospermopsis sp. FACHB-1094]
MSIVEGKSHIDSAPLVTKRLNKAADEPVSLNTAVVATSIYDCSINARSIMQILPKASFNSSDFSCALSFFPSFKLYQVIQ